VAALERLYDHLATRSGDIADLSALASFCEVSRAAIDRWTRALEQADLAVRLYRFTGRGKPNPASRPKLYVSDPGIVAAFGAPADHGRLVEAAALRHLAEVVASRDGQIGYFLETRGAEIDFVVRAPNADEALAIEVTSSEMVRDEKTQKLRAALRSSGLRRALLVHRGWDSESREYSEGIIRTVPLVRFLSLCSAPETGTAQLWEAGS